MEFDTHELAWAAGFFDGEGCASFLAKKSQMTMSAAQVDGRTLERFHAAVLGLGRMYGPYRRSSDLPQWSAHYEWRVNAWGDLQAVVALLWRFLSPQKRERISAMFVRYRNAPTPRHPRRRVDGLSPTCVHGHPWTPETTYRNSSGRRGCRTCKDERTRESRVRRRAAAVQPGS